MPQSFLLNLTDGRYAKLTVALQLAPGPERRRERRGAGSSSWKAPGTLPEEPLVREIVTNTITNQSGEALVTSTRPQRAIRQKILAAITQADGHESRIGADPGPHRPIGAAWPRQSSTSSSIRRTQPSAAAGSDIDLSRLSDIPMELSVEIGRAHMTVGETLDLRVGSVVELERSGRRGRRPARQRHADRPRRGGRHRRAVRSAHHGDPRRAQGRGPRRIAAPQSPRRGRGATTRN